MKLWLIKIGFIILTVAFPPAVLLTPALYMRIVVSYTEPCFRNAMRTIAARNEESAETETVEDQEENINDEQ